MSGDRAVGGGGVPGAPRVPGRGAMVALALGLLSAGCGPDAYPTLGAVRDPGGSPLAFGVLPFLDREALLAALRPLTAHLGRRLGRTVHPVVVPGYAELWRRVRAGRLDLGWLPEAGPVVALARPVAGSADEYRGAVVARAGAGLLALSDLRGRTLVLVDRTSRSGFLAPLALLEAAGLDPLRDLAGIALAGSHDRALAEVLEGRRDAAAVSELLVRDPAASGLVVLARTPPLVPDPIVARADLDPSLRERLRELLLGLGDDPEGAAALATLGAALGTPDLRFAPVQGAAR